MFLIPALVFAAAAVTAPTPDPPETLSPEPARQLVRSIYAELIGSNTSYSTGQTTPAAEAMAKRFEVLPERFEVVDLAIEDDPDRAVFVRHGLVPAAQVDDRQPAMPERDGAVDVQTCIVRPPVSQDVAHPFQHGSVGRFVPRKVDESADATHGLSSASSHPTGHRGRYGAGRYSGKHLAARRRGRS